MWKTKDTFFKDSPNSHSMVIKNMGNDFWCQIVPLRSEQGALEVKFTDLISYKAYNFTNVQLPTQPFYKCIINKKLKIK